MAAITYIKIFNESQVANSLIGMSREEFQQLYAEFEVAYWARENQLDCTRRYKRKRKRHRGAGRKHKYDLRDRLLMTLFWLRAYTTYEVLGSFYDLNKTTVEDNIKSVLDTLAMTTFHFELPQAEIPKLRSVEEVLDVFPDVRTIIDTQE